MKVLYRGKIIGDFIDFTEEFKVIVKLHNLKTKKLLLSECSIVCDSELRHQGSPKNYQLR